jgi:hypothetical protein
MGNFQRLLTKHKLNYGSFNTWSSRCEKQGGKGAQLLAAYEKSLRRVEIFESALQTWMMRHVDDSDFEARLKAKGKQLEDLEAASVGILERIFAQYRKDVRGR